MIIFVDRAMLPEGWGTNVRIEIDAGGTITSVTADASAGDAQVVRGTLLPGMPNAHSHAFQRAMAGNAERRTHATDDFWSWRDTMYMLANTLTPDDLFAIARAAYREMLAAGYTSVAEFHYIHRDPTGAWYADRAVMAKALVAAATEAGIAITLLPALYAHGDADGTPLGAQQKRFATSVDDVLAIAAHLRDAHANDPNVTIGVCAHSLRAVTPGELAELVAGSPENVPIHLHVAEQQREVEAVEAALGARPVAWLLENANVDARWTLVHATHMTPRECELLAGSGATVALAPTTEANLGDGFFPLREYLDGGGAFAIGSDSNVSIDVVEELRWLEYGQRLVTRSRNVAARFVGASNGEVLYREAVAGGAVALGRKTGTIARGSRADLVLLETSDDARDVAMDRYLFASLPRRPSAVMVAGRWTDSSTSDTAHHSTQRRVR